MRYKLLRIDEVCKILSWGETKFYERKSGGLFPRPFNLSGSRKGNLYFQHEIEFYIERAIELYEDDDFKALSELIERNRRELRNDAA